MRLKLAAVAAFAVLSTGCYHVTVDTGATPGSQTIEKEWALSWIGGLIPPATVETASQCKSGVARVETQMSLPNMLVNAITGGIFSPMSIKVTCAQGRAADARSIKSQGDKANAVKEAVSLSAALTSPVYVEF